MELSIHAQSFIGTVIEEGVKVETNHGNEERVASAYVKILDKLSKKLALEIS